jgi:hypothetical protein
VKHDGDLAGHGDDGSPAVRIPMMPPTHSEMIAPIIPR